MGQKLRRLWQRWRKQDAASVEHVLLAILIVAGMAIFFWVLGNRVCGIFANLDAMLGGAASNGNASC